MNSKRTRLSLAVALITVLAAAAHAGPIIDGRWGPGDGYTDLFNLTLNVEGLKKDDPLILAPDLGKLLTYEDPVSGDVSVIFIQPLTLVDNTYGVNAIGWGIDAPSGKGHKFSDLVNSDKAHFAFTDALGNVVLDFELDYFAEIGAGYGSPGVEGKDGKVITGSASDLLAWGTSLEYDFNTLGHDTFTTDSPLTDDSYTDPASAPGWIFDVIYEVKVDGDVFGDNGFGGVTIPVVHDSPNKIGKNKVYTDDPAVPETGTLTAFLLGLTALSRRKRR